MANRSSLLSAIPALALGAAMAAVPLTASLTSGSIESADAAALSIGVGGSAGVGIGVGSGGSASGHVGASASVGGAGVDANLDSGADVALAPEGASVEASLDGSGSVDTSAVNTSAANISAADTSALAATSIAADSASTEDLNALASAALSLGATPTVSVIGTLDAYQDAVASGDVAGAATLLSSVAAGPVTADTVSTVNAQLGLALDSTSTAALTAAIDSSLSAQAAQ